MIDCGFSFSNSNPKLLEPIRKSLKLYPSMRAEINGLAIRDEDGTILVHVPEDQTGASQIAKSEGNSHPIHKARHIFQRQVLDRVALLNLDIEGHELAALRVAEQALKHRRIKAICFEYFESFLRVPT
jgi:FkbM family methyltransferase